MNLEELCSWLSHQKGMMAQTYAKDLAKYIVRKKPLSDEEIEMLAYKFNLLDDFPHEFVRAIEERHGIK